MVFLGRRWSGSSLVACFATATTAATRIAATAAVASTVASAVMVSAAAAIAVAFAGAFTSARLFFLLAATGLLLASARGLARRATARAAATVMPKQSAEAAGATVAMPAAATSAATMAAMATKGVGLRLQAHEGDGHRRHSQHQPKHISLHQNYLRTHGQKMERSTGIRCAIDEPTRRSDVLAAPASHSLVHGPRGEDLVRTPEPVHSPIVANILKLVTVTVASVRMSHI